MSIAASNPEPRRGWRHGRSRRALSAMAVTTACAAAAAGCASASPGSGSTQAVSQLSSLKGRQLVVASWGGPWTADGEKYFFEPFEKATGVKVVVATPGGGFDAHVTAMEQAHSIQWDLLDAPSTDTSVLQAQGYLEPYPSALVNTITPLVAPGTERPSTSTVYHLLYGATTEVIACRPKAVKKCPTTPAEFWDVKAFPGTRAIAVQTPVDPILYALEADGVPASNLFPIDLTQAINKLKQIKPSVSVWTTSAAQGVQVLADGTADIALTANSVASQVPGITMSWNGALMDDEGWCVVKGSPNADVAFAFIKWWAEHPQNQIQFATAQTTFVPARDAASLINAKALATAPYGKQGITQISGLALAKQASAVAQALQNFLAG